MPTDFYGPPPIFGRADSGDRGLHRCPVQGCGWLFPPELWNAAMAAHAPNHTAEQWREVLDNIDGWREGSERHHAEELARLDADRRLVEQWRDSAGVGVHE